MELKQITKFWRRETFFNFAWMGVNSDRWVEVAENNCCKRVLRLLFQICRALENLMRCQCLEYK